MFIKQNISLTSTQKVFFDDMENPVMEAEDQHFTYGHIGFGSFNDTGVFDIRMWEAETAPEKKGFFNHP